MDVQRFLAALKADPAYADQIVHVHESPAREARCAESCGRMSGATAAALEKLGISRLYRHQDEAIRHVRRSENVLVATGTASGKTLCYTLPLLERLEQDPSATALLLFPTKALTQDQFRGFSAMLEAAGRTDVQSGVFDGDTPSPLRRRLRDHASAIFSNPDMVHAALMPQHGRWARFLQRLQFLVLDELHVYTGIFGSNMALLLARLFRLCRHYGSDPAIVACSATISNPGELSEQLTGRPFRVIAQDGSPRGRRVYVFWNPPRRRHTAWRSRRSANVEAHELMARLVADGTPTITFSKAKMTAEMIHRYVCDKLRETAPGQIGKVTPYRGGYLPEERREIERRLFSGELVGVSTTSALELGIDVGALEASIVVGYPGTRASFLQQAGRAGRKGRDALVFLIGLDTSVNQYIMSNPDYIFDRCVERAVIDPANPFVAVGHLRCATSELAVGPEELPLFGPHAETVLKVLHENRKVREIEGRWYYAAAEVPQHEVSLRNYADANVLIEDVDTGAVLGEVNQFDAEPILHPEAIYMHRGETYRVLTLDLDRNIASVKREEVDYYTQPLGGTDIHHIDHRLREKVFGTGALCWGEATAYFNTHAYEKVHFYSLDAISVHGVDLPTMVLETMAFWIVPPEDLMERVRLAGLDAHSGLRAIGYATRMMLPLFITCSTLDFSHTVGSANSPWNAIFVYERYPHGLGFTEKAYEIMDRILPAVREQVRACDCEKGCPCCVGKPLRGYATWNVERGEASIPNKAAALMILDGLLGDGQDLCRPDREALSDSSQADTLRLEQALRRRLERMREPQVFHPIVPQPEVGTAYPRIEPSGELDAADAGRRAERRRGFERDMHKRIAKKLGPGGLDPGAGAVPVPPGMKKKGSNLKPTDFPGKPQQDAPPSTPVPLGDPLAARARRRLKKGDKERS